MEFWLLDGHNGSLW